MKIMTEQAIRQRHCHKCKEVIEKKEKCLRIRLSHFPYTSANVCKKCVRNIVTKLGRSKIDLSGKGKPSAIKKA